MHFLSYRTRFDYTETFHPGSPSCAGSVYIICVVGDNGSLEYSGTAFAVSSKRAVTCFRNIHDAATGDSLQKIYEKCVLVSYLEKSAADSSVLKIWHQRAELLQFERQQSYVIYSHGRCKGASGAPVVTMGGTVIGYHTESFNERRFPPPVGEPVRSHLKQTRLTAGTVAIHTAACSNQSDVAVLQPEFAQLDETVASMSELVYSTKSHADHSRATVICKLPNLMNCII